MEKVGSTLSESRRVQKAGLGSRLGQGGSIKEGAGRMLPFS